MSPAPRTGVALGVLVLALAGAVLLVRPGTASDEETVQRARAAQERDPTTSLTTVPTVPTLLPEGEVVIRADGIDGLRLGMSTEEVAAAGFVVHAWEEVRGCTRVTPGMDDTGPGLGVAAWLVDDRVAGLTLDSRAGDAASYLGPGLGDQLAELEGVEDVIVDEVTAQVPWQREPRRIAVARTAPTYKVRMNIADTAGDGVIDHVQLMWDVAAHCALAYEGAMRAREAALPVLGAQGWGEIRLGRALRDIPDEVSLDRRGVSGTGCEVVVADHVPGLTYVLLSDGLVRAVAVDAGRHEAGFAVGDTAAQVRDAVLADAARGTDEASSEVPGFTEIFLQTAWDQGLSADWEFTEENVQFTPSLPRVRVPELDAELVGPDVVLGLMRVGGGC